MAKNLGLEETPNQLPVKARNRGYKPAETLFSLMGMFQSGGVALEDMGLLAGDEGMRTMLGTLPAANTVGEFLRRFGNAALYRLGRIQLETAVRVIEASELNSITVDVDAFFLESQKSDVKMNDEGEWGSNPVAVTCAELKMPLAGLFRNAGTVLWKVISSAGGIIPGAAIDCAFWRPLFGRFPRCSSVRARKK